MEVCLRLQTCFLRSSVKPRGSPALVLIGSGGTGATLYVMCLTLFSPDVSWDRKNNPELWNKLGPNEQYKFYSVNVDYSMLKKEDPNFKP